MAPVGSLNQATAYESPAHSLTGMRPEPWAPPTAWELTVSCSISLPERGFFSPFHHDALRQIIPDNACILRITADAGTELAEAYSPDTVIASFMGKEVYDPWAFYLHMALLRQAFAHCGKFPTAASRRSLGRVSVTGHTT
ncbi:hypothetical protein Tco_1520485 [Tanacetum coccineum]